MSTPWGNAKPIDTWYHDCLFRSRLESRWAVFMDTLGVRWQYEPEGFEFGDMRYLPDFWLPELETWIEIKPDAAPVEAIEKAARLCEATGKPVVIIQGAVDFELLQSDDALIVILPHKLARGGASLKRTSSYDFGVMWAQCPECEAIGFISGGGFVGPSCEHDRKLAQIATPALFRAYGVARSYRFERGGR